MNNKYLAFILAVIINVTIYCVFQIVINGMNLMNDINMKGATCYINNTEEEEEFCSDYSLRVWFNGVILGGGAVITFIWLLWCLSCLIMIVRWKTEVKHIKLESVTLQRQITEKTQEIAYLQRQLNNERNDRRAARVDNTPPPGAEPENERQRLLPIRYPDYQ